MMKAMKHVVVGAVLASVAGIAMAQGDKAIASAVKARKAYMQVLSFNMGQIGGMAKGKAPYDAAVASAAAKNLSLAAQMSTGAMWIKGSDNVSLSSDETRALPKIWEDGSEVGDKHQAMVDATAHLAAVAGNGQPALAEAFGPVGKSCGGCHKPFRAAKDE